MITIQGSMVDFMDERPVPGGTVKVTVTLEGTRRGGPPPRNDHESDPLPTDRDVETRSIVGTATAGADGRFELQLDAGPAWNELDAICAPSSLGGTLDYEVCALGLLHRLSGPLVEERDLDLQPRFLLDLMKVVVGETTQTSTRIWFCLSTVPVNGMRYVCELYAGDARDAPLVHSQRLGFPATPPSFVVAELDRLSPDTRYRAELRVRGSGEPDAPGSGYLVATAWVRTLPASFSSLSFAFGSCHQPSSWYSMNRWVALADRDDYDMLLLIGDQIYEDGLGDDPDARDYSGRYQVYWASRPMRQVLRRVPTYMICDDHEIVDDWGSDPRYSIRKLLMSSSTEPFGTGRPGSVGGGALGSGSIGGGPIGGGPGGLVLPLPWDEPGLREAARLLGRGDEVDRRFDEAHRREAAGLTAYRQHQQSHNPGGIHGPLHYSMQRGPCAFFVLDDRSKRGDSATAPVLGTRQRRALRDWADSQAVQDSDIIFLVAPVPLAFVSVPELQRILAEGRAQAEQLAGALGALGGLAVGGPLAAAAGYVIGAAAGGHFFHDQLEDAVGGDPMTEIDLIDHWSHESNQADTAWLLDLLHELAHPPTVNGQIRRRAVFVLGGDVHMAAMHSIFRTGDGVGRTQPFALQVVSSPISHAAYSDTMVARAVAHMQPGQHFGLMTYLDFDSADFGDQPGTVVLDDDRGGNYVSVFGDFLNERNFGRIEVTTIDQADRRYRVGIRIEGQEDRLAYDVDLDLHRADPYTVEPVLGQWPAIRSLSACTVEDRIEVTAVGASGHVWDIWQKEPGPWYWSHWKDRGGDASAIATVVDLHETSVIAVLGGDGHVRTAQQSHRGAGPWRAWKDQQAGAVAFDLGLDDKRRARLFVADADGDVASQRLVAPGQWRPATAPPRLSAGVRQLAAARNEDGRSELWVVGGDGALWHSWELDGQTSWSAWKTVGGSMRNLRVTSDFFGRISVFAVGTDDALWFIEQRKINGSWSSLESLGGKVREIAIGRHQLGGLEIFAMTMDNTVVHRRQASIVSMVTETSWHDWESLGGVVKAIAVARDGLGSLTLFGIGQNDRLWYRRQKSAGSGPWSSWAQVPH